MGNLIGILWNGISVIFRVRKLKRLFSFYEFKLKEMDAPEKLVQIENWGEFSLGDIFKFY